MTREDYELLATGPKDFLLRGWQIQNKVAAKQERIKRWQNIALSITAEVKPDGGFGSSYPKSKVEGCVVKIADLQKELEQDIRELLRIEKSIQEAIELIPDKNNIRFMLELRYLSYFSWVAVADGLGRSERRIYTLHETALKQLQAVAQEKIS